MFSVVRSPLIRSLMEKKSSIHMKRKISEIMENRSEIRSAIEELSFMVKLKPEGDKRDDNAILPTQPFLSLCNLIVDVLDKIGPTMAVLRQDVDQNIQRLEKVYESDPSVFSNLVEILKKEASEGNAKKISSSSRAFAWLTRCWDFTVALLQKLTPKDSVLSMEQVVGEAYDIALKPWHGWIASAAFKIGLQLLPDKKSFIDLLMAKDENYDKFLEEIESFISLLLPFLEELHSILRSHCLDEVKSK